jgi:pyruvate/2-oxoglutarate dehydrogenase complex dihydrolipoamide dehydrogenase (E3) component
VLVAVGRVANLTGYGLEELGIPTGRTIETNAYLQTRYPNIYAVGDVAGPYQFTHTAAHQAWYAAVNALFSGFKRFKADYRVIPWVTFVSPEVARVGLSEAEAQAQGIAYEVTRYGLDDLDRAIADSDAHGFVKVLTPPGKGPHPGGDHRRRARRRVVGRIRAGHEARTGAQQDPRHHPHLPDHGYVPRRNMGGALPCGGGAAMELSHHPFPPF